MSRNSEAYVNPIIVKTNSTAAATILINIGPVRAILKPRTNKHKRSPLLLLSASGLDSKTRCGRAVARNAKAGPIPRHFTFLQGGLEWGSRPWVSQECFQWTPIRSAKHTNPPQRQRLSLSVRQFLTHPGH